jgi:hypothetical protein
MPFIFLFAFIIIYMIAMLRSVFAATIGFKIAKCMKLKFKKPLESDDEDVKKKSKFKSFLLAILRGVSNVFILA